MVSAKFDGSNKVFLAVVDFGDTSVIMPISAVYDAEIIVGDEALRNPVIFKFASFDTVFRKNSREESNQLNDAYY